SMWRTNLGPVRSDVNAAWDLASHDIAIANAWLGQEPISAAATGHAWIQPGIEDAVFATLRYPGDVLVQLHASWLSGPKRREISIVGERGALSFDEASPPAVEPLRLECEHFVDCIRRGARPRTDGRQGLAVVRALEAIGQSLREGGRTVPLTPASR